MHTPFITANLAAIALLSTSVVVTAQEWKEIPQREAHLVFFADDFGLTKDAALLGTGDSPSERYELGAWVSRTEILLLQLSELAGSSWYWTREPQLNKEALEGWGYLQAKSLSMGQKRKTTNVFGRISYLPFRADDDACFGFSQSFGRLPARFQSFSKTMIGFYCQGDGRAVPPDKIEAMLKSIGVKDFKVP